MDQTTWATEHDTGARPQYDQRSDARLSGQSRPQSGPEKGRLTDPRRCDNGQDARAIATTQTVDDLERVGQPALAAEEHASVILRERFKARIGGSAGRVARQPFEAFRCNADLPKRAIDLLQRLDIEPDLVVTTRLSRTSREFGADQPRLSGC